MRPPANPPGGGANVPPELVQVSTWIQGVGGYGSGTCIDTISGRAFILTCKHVAMRDVESLAVKFPGKATRPATFLRADPKADLAILITNDGDAPTVQIGERTPGRGTKVYQVGYPGGTQTPVKRTGAIFGFTGKVMVEGGSRTLFDSLQVDLFSRPGDSGSGIFTESDRKLVAVLWGGPGSNRPRAREAAAVGTEDIRRFVAETYREKGWQTPWERCRPGKPPAPVPPPAPPPTDPGPRPAPPTPPPAPVDPPLSPPTPGPDLKNVLDKLREHDGILKGLRDKLAGLPDSVKADIKAAIDGMGAKLADVDATVKGIEPGIGGKLADGLKGLTEKVASHGGALAAIKDKIEAAHAANGGAAVEMDKAAKLIGFALPWILGAAGLGAATPAVMFGVKGIGWLLKAKATVAAVKADGGLLSAAAARHDEPVTRLVVSQAPPLPQQTIEKHEYVPYEVDLYRAAVTEAADKLVKKQPGIADTVDHFMSAIDQVYSGMKKPRA